MIMEIQTEEIWRKEEVKDVWKFKSSGSYGFVLSFLESFEILSKKT